MQYSFIEIRNCLCHILQGHSMITFRLLITDPKSERNKFIDFITTSGATKATNFTPGGQVLFRRMNKNAETIFINDKEEYMIGFILDKMSNIWRAIRPKAYRSPDRQKIIDEILKILNTSSQQSPVRGNHKHFVYLPDVLQLAKKNISYPNVKVFYEDLIQHMQDLNKFSNSEPLFPVNYDV